MNKAIKTLVIVLMIFLLFMLLHIKLVKSKPELSLDKTKASSENEVDVLSNSSSWSQVQKDLFDKYGTSYVLANPDQFAVQLGLGETTPDGASVSMDVHNQTVILN